jgi:hypothetical protein
VAEVLHGVVFGTKLKPEHRARRLVHLQQHFCAFGSKAFAALCSSQAALARALRAVFDTRVAMDVSSEVAAETLEKVCERFV